MSIIGLHPADTSEQGGSPWRMPTERDPADDPRPAGLAALLDALWPGEGRPPAWQDRAECAGMPTAPFDRATLLAASVCGACPVSAECAAEQLRWEAETGRTTATTTACVRGGMTATARVVHHTATTSRENNTTFSRENTTPQLAA